MEMNEVIHDVMGELYWTTLGKKKILRKLRKYREVNVNDVYCELTLCLPWPKQPPTFKNVGGAWPPSHHPPWGVAAP